MKKEEILAICIDEIRSGKSTLEECLIRYPEFAGELCSIMEIAVRLKPEEVVPSPEFKQRTKRLLFDRTQDAPVKASRGVWYLPERMMVRVLVYVFTALIILGAGGGSTVYAAQGSLPGDPLYTVKIGIENLQVFFTTGAAAKADLYLKLAQRRVDEAIQQVKLERDVDAPALETVKQQFDNAIKELSSLDDPEVINETLSRMSAATLDQQIELEQVIAGASQSSQPVLEQTLDETRRSSTIAGVGYANQDFLDSQPSVTDEELDKGQVKIEGTLVSVRNRTWNVGGTILEDVYYSGKVPETGSYIKIEGMVKNGKLFLTGVNVSDDSTGLTKVEGQFGGTKQDGSADVGGISVRIDESSSQLKNGDKVRLEGSQEDNELKVTGKESQEYGDKGNTTLQGELTAVSTANNTITVKVTGNRITINVNEAEIVIKNRHDHEASLSDLKHQIGSDVRVEGLYKKNGTLFAEQVRVSEDD